MPALWGGRRRIAKFGNRNRMALRHVVDLNPFSMQRLRRSARIGNEKRALLIVGRFEQVDTPIAHHIATGG